MKEMQGTCKVKERQRKHRKQLMKKESRKEKKRGYYKLVL
jgi:hypothetical protein